MIDSESLLHRLENDLVNYLVDKLENSEISLKRASLIAKFVISHLPENLTDEQLLQILPSLDSTFTELTELINEYMNKYAEIEKAEVTQNIHILMRSGRFDEASQLMKDYFKKTIQK